MAGSINKPKKPQSKRTSTRLRNKIVKRSAAKQRKNRKQDKKNPQWKSRIKKDPGIPNSFPYKEQILEEIEQARMRKDEEARKRKELVKARRAEVQTGTDEIMNEEDDFDSDLENDEDTMELDGDTDEKNPMAALLASARRAAEEYERDHESDDEMDDDDDDESAEIPIGHMNSRKAFDKVFKEVVEQADVVLYVLDARDPEGTRSRDVEQAVMEAAHGGKRLILVLNKIDLIPQEVLKTWLQYLRRSFPTLPLRASSSAPNAHTFSHGDLTPQKTSAALLNALKAFAASRQLKRAVTVGVVGYPNVGKSSVINALLSRLSGKRGSKGAKACPAGAEAGVTTGIRAVKIDSKLTLLDSPGIVFPSSSPTTSGLVSLKNASEAHAHLILLNAVPPKLIDDPIPAVTLLLKRLSTSPNLLKKLTDNYELPPLLSANGDVTTDFLVQVARKRGRLGRGGVPNLNAAGMTVVTDWRDGRIQGWTNPPAVDDKRTADSSEKTGKAAGESSTDQKVIVTEWAKEFKIDGLWGDEGAEANIVLA